MKDICNKERGEKKKGWNSLIRFRYYITDRNLMLKSYLLVSSKIFGENMYSPTLLESKLHTSSPNICTSQFLLLVFSVLNAMNSKENDKQECERAID